MPQSPIDVERFMPVLDSYLAADKPTFSNPQDAEIFALGFGFRYSDEEKPSNDFKIAFERILNSENHRGLACPELDDLRNFAHDIWQAARATAVPQEPFDIAKATEMSLTVPAPLHPDTKMLVHDFAEALAKKLHKAEEKYGYSDGWKTEYWANTCRAKLLEHVAKGDPRDVAAYCAFLWYHKESTTAPIVSAVPDGKDAAIQLWNQCGDELQKAHDVLARLSSSLGQGGLDAESVDPLVFENRIRDGILAIISVEKGRASQVINKTAIKEMVDEVYGRKEKLREVHREWLYNFLLIAVRKSQSIPDAGEGDKA